MEQFSDMANEIIDNKMVFSRAAFENRNFIIFVINILTELNFGNLDSSITF
jgi:hypothetical protein